MATYIIKRLAHAIVVLWVVITITFLLMHAIPGGPFTSERNLPPVVLKNIETRPAHPYTQGLLASLPGIASNGNNKLHVIEGQPPNLLREIKGCAFQPRCQFAMEICGRQMPPKNTVYGEHWTKCWLHTKNGGGSHE